MIKKLMLATVAAFSIASTANADAIAIATGKPNGGYDARSKVIAERLIQRGYTVTTENKNGSNEISLSVCSGSADVGIMQVDAIYARALEGCTLKPVAVYGKEYAFILFPPGSDNDELSDLDENSAVAVDTVGSGSELFWLTISKIELGDDGSKDEWANSQVVTDPLELAYASAEIGDIDAVVIVRKSNSPDVIRLLELGWTFGEMYDKDIDDLSYKGEPLYDNMQSEVSVRGGIYRPWVYEVRSFIVVSTDVTNGNKKTFADITSSAQK